MGNKHSVEQQQLINSQKNDDKMLKEHCLNFIKTKNFSSALETIEGIKNENIKSDLTDLIDIITRKKSLDNIEENATLITEYYIKKMAKKIVELYELELIDVILYYIYSIHINKYLDSILLFDRNGFHKNIVELFKLDNNLLKMSGTKRHYHIIIAVSELEIKKNNKYAYLLLIYLYLSEYIYESHCEYNSYEKTTKIKEEYVTKSISLIKECYDKNIALPEYIYKMYYSGRFSNYIHIKPYTNIFDNITETNDEYCLKCAKKCNVIYYNGCQHGFCNNHMKLLCNMC